MRRFNSSALRTLGTTALLVGAAGFAVSIANAATQPLSDLNAGPSAAAVPASATDPVVFFVYPREIVNTAIQPVFANIFPLTDSEEVEASGSLGLRWRSRALIPPSSGVNTLSEITFAAATDGFDADASNSYILFLSLADALTLEDASDVDTFVTNGTAGTDFVQYLLSNAALNGGAGFADADVEEADLDNGITILTSELAAATPDGGGVAGDYENFEVAILVIDDVADGAADIVSELAAVEQPVLVAPADAVFDPDNQTIRIQANRQLVDDFDTDNPADTTVANLTDADFRVVSGGSLGGLAAFLSGLNDANSVATVDVLSNPDQTHAIIEIGLTTAVTDDDDIATILATTIGFTGTDFDSVIGENNSTNSNTYQLMDRPGDIAVDSAELLQGSGSDQLGNVDVWMAVTLAGNVTNAGGGGQFLLLNEDGDIVAFSNTVTATRPTAGDVAGIDDEDQDGTADDAIIEEGDNVLFAAFTLLDGDDSINSDGTWTDEGNDDSREERQALTLVKNTTDNDPDDIVADEANFASTDLGDEVADDTSVAVEDLARPQLVEFITQATEAGSDLCELVNVVKLVFDETVTLSDAGQFAIAYDDATTISDLTGGLPANLSIPTIDTLGVADFEDQVLAATAGALATMYVSNDSLVFNAPLIPVDGTAANGQASILSGTGDEAYIGGVNVNAVEGAENLGNTATGTFSAVEDGDFTAGVTIADGAAPALLAATASGDEVSLGFSENVNNPSGSSEAESYFFFNEDGVRLDISAAFIDSVFDNIFELEDVIFDSEATIEVGVFNPGFLITDNDDNAIDPIVAKTKTVEIVPPAATFKEDGIAFVDDETNLVTTVVLKTTGEVEINGTEDAVLGRFFVRGDDFGSDNGEFDTLDGLVESILVGTEERNDGCFLFTLTMVEDCPLPQEDFFVQYNDSDDQEEPADSTIVDAGNGAEVPSEVIFVQVARPSTPSPEGNPIGETYVGTIDLGSVTEDALGAEIAAYIFKPLSECGDVRFVYKGIVYTGSVAGLDGSDALIADGTVLYFHPQLRGQDDFCDGTMSPCGIVNSKPDLDLYQVAELTTETDQEGNGGINSDNGATDIETETTSQVLLYQNMDTSFVVRPIALTVRRDAANPSRFTLTGAGVSNGTITFSGEFTFIGSTYVTGDADENGTRPYTLHTRGEKNYLGCPVVFVVCPDSNFSDVEPFLANNTLVRRVTFAADNQADVTTGSKSFTFENNRPITFNIDAAAVHGYPLDELEQDDWAFLPAAATSPTRVNTLGAGQDFGTTATLPNRLTVPTGTGTATAPFNAVTAFPTGTNASGFFLMLDEDDKEPQFVEIETVLALDTRGVYCGSAGGLNRIASGYAYAVEFGGLDYSNYTWFTFGTLVEDVAGGTITVTPNATNGGWTLFNNNTGADITASTGGALTGNQIMMSMNNEEGVLIFIEGQPQFSDFEAVPANEGFLIFTDTQFID